MQIVSPYYGFQFSAHLVLCLQKNYVLAGNSMLPFMEIYSNLFKHGMDGCQLIKVC